jgi:hypothetical protein
MAKYVCDGDMILDPFLVMESISISLVTLIKIIVLIIYFKI